MKGLNMDLHISRPVKVLIAVFLLLVFIVTIYLPVARNKALTEGRIATAQKAYTKAVGLVNSYNAARTNRVDSGVTLQERLFSYLEHVTRDLGLESKVDSIRPENRTDADGEVVEAVHVAFKGISLEEFVKFLYQIEVLKREISIQAISIKKDDKKNLITQMTLQKLD